MGYEFVMGCRFVMGLAQNKAQEHEPGESAEPNQTPGTEPTFKTRFQFIVVPETGFIRFSQKPLWTEPNRTGYTPTCNKFSPVEQIHLILSRVKYSHKYANELHNLTNFIRWTLLRTKTIKEY